MANINTGKLNFQVSPDQMQRQRFVSMMYDDRNTRGPYFYPLSPYAQLPSIQGLRGLRGLGALGSTNVEALAQAMQSGQISPTFTTQYFQPSYTPAGQLEALPSWIYMDSASAGLIAQLLGGTTFQAPPPGNYNGTGIPNTTWIRLSDGSTLVPGDLIQPGTVLSFQDLCQAENYLVQSISNGAFGSSCGQGGSTPPVILTPPVNTSPLPITSTPIVNQIPTFSFTDLTTGEDMTNGGTFAQGDQFRVAITNAAPNAAVTVTATQNGVTSTSKIGTTSATGSFQTTGTMDATTVGNWTEQWQIPAGTGALALAAQVSFNVVPPTGGTQTGSGTDSPPSPPAPTLCPAGQTYVAPTVAGGTYSCVAPAGGTTTDTALYVGLAIAAALVLFMGNK